MREVDPKYRLTLKKKIRHVEDGNINMGSTSADQMDPNRAR